MMIDRRLLEETRPWRFRLTLLLISGVVLAGLIVLQAWFLSRSISLAFPEPSAEASPAHYLLGFLIVSLLRVLLNWYRTILASHLAVRIKTSLRARLHRHLHRQGVLAQEQLPTGESTWLLTEGVERLESWFGEYLPQLISAAFIPLTILFFVFPGEWITGVVLLVTAPLIPLFMVLIGDLAKARTTRQWRTLTRMSGHFLDVLLGLATLKQLGRSREEADRIATITDQFRRHTMDVLKVAFLSALILELVTTISTAIVAVEIGVRLLYAKMEFGPALFVLILAPEFYLPLRLLGLRFHAGMDGVEAAARIFAVLERPLADVPTADLPATTSPPGITFQNVSARYGPELPEVLQQLNLELAPGKTTVLAGASGAGKSTVIRLLLGELQPSAGTIGINGPRILSELNPERWLQQLAWVPQQPHIFADTLAYNLRLAKPDATVSEMEQALVSARLDNWYQSLPAGMETDLGEDGIRLSEGERQRLAIARAVLKDAPLLILDEHTSNLDPASEQALHKALQEVSAHRTVLLIAHRLSSIMQGDQIYLIENGRVTESGTPGELVASDGQLAEWLALQKVET